MGEEKKLNMDDIFGDAPVVDIEQDAAHLFEDEVEIEDLKGGDKPEGDESGNTDPQPKEGKQPDETDEDSLESVVGDKGQEDVKDTDNKSGDNDDDPSPNIFSSLAALLKEKNLLSSPDSEIETEEDFVNAFKKQIESSEYSDLTDRQKEYLKALREGIPEEDVKQHISNVEQLNSITEDVIKEDANLRQRLIYNDLLNKGFSEEKAAKHVQRSVQMEEDLEDAKDALESIKQYNQAQFDKQKETLAQKKEREAKEQEQRVKRIKDKIKSTEEIIKGYKISDNVKEKIEQNMFKIVGKNENGVEENSLMKYARENKDDFDLKLYYLFTITNGFQDFSSIEKTKNTKILSDLERAMKSSTKIKDPSTPTYLQDPESYIDIQGHEFEDNWDL